MQNFKHEFLLFQSFLRGETQIPKDEAFKDCIEVYLNVFLRSERIAQVTKGGALSQHDCREVFRWEFIPADNAESNDLVALLQLFVVTECPKSWYIVTVKTNAVNLSLSGIRRRRKSEGFQKSTV